MSLSIRPHHDYAFGRIQQQLKIAAENITSIEELSASFLSLLHEDFNSFANNEAVLITKNTILPITNQNITSESPLFARFDAAILNNDYDAFTRLYLHYKEGFVLEGGNAELVNITTEIDALLEKLINAIPNVDRDHAASLQEAIKMMLDEGARLPLNDRTYKEWFLAQREKAVEPFQKKILASIHLHESPQDNILSMYPQEILLSVISHLSPNEVYEQLEINKADGLLLPALKARTNNKDYLDFFKRRLFSRSFTLLLSLPVTPQLEDHTRELLISIANGTFSTDTAEYKNSRFASDSTSSRIINSITMIPEDILFSALKKLSSIDVLTNVKNHLFFNHLYIFAVNNNDQGLLSSLLNYEVRCYCAMNDITFDGSVSIIRFPKFKRDDFLKKTKKNQEITDPLNIMEAARNNAILTNIAANKNNDTVKCLLQYSPSIVSQALFSAITSKNEIMTEYLLNEYKPKINVSEYHFNRGNFPYYLCFAMTHGTRNASVQLLQHTHITYDLLRIIKACSNIMKPEKRLETASFFLQYGVILSKKSGMLAHYYHSTSSFINFNSRLNELFREHNPNVI